MKRKSVILSVWFLFISLFYISCSSSLKDRATVGWPDALLHEAVKADDIKEVERLLTEEGWEEVIASSSLYRPDPQLKQVNVNLEGNYGKPPLFYVKSLEMAQLLISKGADVNARDDVGDTLLHEAQTPAIAKLFLEHEADVNAKDNNGNTPPHEVRTLAIAKLFLEHGADVHVKNNNGRTAYEKVTRYAYYPDEIGEFLDCANTKKLQNLSECL